MNERIKELAEQAKDYADYYSMLSDSAEQEIFTEKFAELIIRECIELAMNERLRYSSSYNKEAGWAKQLMMIHCATSMDNYKILLQEHFGVEEQATETVELHSCPYAEELYGNYDKMCDCDEERTRQCAMDI